MPAPAFIGAKHSRDAGDHRAQDHRAGDRQRPGAGVQVEDGPEIAADHDRGPVGQVEPAHHAEYQREAERQQPIGGADHRAVEVFWTRSIIVGLFCGSTLPARLVPR